MAQAVHSKCVRMWVCEWVGVCTHAGWVLHGNLGSGTKCVCWSIVGDESEDTGWGQIESLNLTSECQVSNLSEQSRAVSGQRV